MTKTDLYNSTLALKLSYINCNSIYENNYRIGSSYSYDRQREILNCANVYIGILDYMYDGIEVADFDITENDVYVIIQECSKVLKSFKLSYK